MNKTANKLSILVALIAVSGSITLRGQIQGFRFSGTVEGNHADIDFSAEEIDFSDGTIKFGDEVSGTIWVDPTRGMRLAAPNFPPNNFIYSGGLRDVDVKINGVPFIASEGRNQMDIGIFDDAETEPDRLEFPLGAESADAVIFVSFGGIQRVGHSEEQFSFMLNLTDTSGGVLQGASYPEMFELERFDLAKGFIRPSSPELFNPDFGAMFQIESFEFVGTRTRPVIAEGPKSQTVEAGDSIRLTMVEVRGNSGVKCQWSLNGVDLPGETLPGLTLDDIQPNEAGTYRVTAWNSLGTTNVASARIEVDGLRHRLNPVALSGWNADVIAAPGEAPTVQDAFDGASAQWFVTDYQGEPDGFPRSGRFTSAVNADIRYQLQPYEDKNVLWLGAANDSGSVEESSSLGAVGRLELVQPKAFTTLALIAASTGEEGDGLASLSLYFADGSRSEMIDYHAGNWWTVPERSASAAIAGLGRFSPGEGEELVHDSPSGYGFGLYETELDLVALGLAGKTITSIEFHRAPTAATTGIFAVSGQSAELYRGVHASWPTEGDRELLEVSVSPDGPWMAPSSDVKTIGEQNLATFDSPRLPRYSRSLLRGINRDLYAHYDFSRGGRDRLGSGMKIELGSNEEIIDRTLFIPNSIPDPATGPFAITATVPRLNYTRYTLVLDFLPMEVPEDGKQNIVTGGRTHAWMQLYLDRGRLALSFDGGKIVEVIEDVAVRPEQWHRVICAADIRTGLVNLVLDGVHVLSLDLGERYSYEVSGTRVPESGRALSFSLTPESEAFVGYIDNLMLYRSGLSPDMMMQVHDALSPSVLAVDFGTTALPSDVFSVGMNVAWESNLEGFELQESKSLDGAWDSIEPLEGVFNERRVFLLKMVGEQGIYRLNKPF